MLPVAVLKLNTGWSQPRRQTSTRTQRGGSLLLVESIAEGGENRVGLHFCPFLRALGQTITMRDHYVNYPKKTKIVTERQPYLRSRPSNSDMLGKQEDNKTPIVVG